MTTTKIEKLESELERARHRRSDLDQRIKDLEDKILECRHQEIIGLVESASLTPQQLAEVIQNAKAGKLGVIPGKESKDVED